MDIINELIEIDKLNRNIDRLKNGKFTDSEQAKIDAITTTAIKKINFDALKKAIMEVL